jgi:hypothetical protein
MRGMHDALIALFGALLGFAGSGLLEWWRSRKEKPRDEREKLAAYVAAMADHLHGMADSFDRREIPHADGHAFDGLYEHLGTLFRPYLDTAADRDLRRLRHQIAQASELDEHLYSIDRIEDLPELQRQSLERALGEWSVEARRLEGDLRAAALRIRSSDTARFGLGSGTRGHAAAGRWGSAPPRM